MLKLLTTDAFATWFSTLPAGPAEDVAETLEVITQLGAGTEAPTSSEWLLWYEHPSVSQKFSFPPHHSLALQKFSQDWGAFLGYVTRVIKHLGSPPFVARLERLDPSAAAAVASAVARIRKGATTRHLALASSPVWRRALGRLPLERADEVVLARFLDLTEVRQAYFAALAAAGFEIKDVPQHSSALREITLRSHAPGLRLLYGIDGPHHRGLIVWGEWLDRSFYGDSVRHAEALWGQFVEGRPLSTRPADTR